MRNMTRINSLVVCLACFISGMARVAFAVERPNILWLTAEDMSPNLGCNGDTDASTPRIDAFAREGVRFTNAFATAPVCSPVRSCLITGMFAASLGTQRLRSQFPVPDHIRPFPALLREAGYYCTNNVKTDYNLAREAPSSAWHGTRAHRKLIGVRAAPVSRSLRCLTS